MAFAWHKKVVFEPEYIKKNNPIPALMKGLTAMLPNNIVTSELNTILTELYNNAVDHGLLNLSSDLKQETDGLEKFYQARKQRLHDLNTGFVKIELSFKPNKKMLEIEVSDSGAGFNCEQYISQPLLLFNRAGKGLYIINKLVTNFEYIADYNLIRLQYRIRQQEILPAASSYDKVMNSNS